MVDAVEQMKMSDARDSEEMNEQEKLNHDLLNVCRSGDVTEVEKLLSRGADIHYRSIWYQRTPLHVSSRHGHKDIVSLLLSIRGIDIDARDQLGYTSLHYCTEMNHPEITKLLLDAEASVNSVNKSGNSPLHDAAYSGFIDTVKLLLGEGADISLRNIDGETALDQARSENKHDVVKYLEEVDSQSASTTPTTTTPHQSSDLVDTDATQEAFQQEVGVCVSNLVVSGSPGSGKTSVVNLSVGEPAPIVRNSTGCVETPVRAIARGTIYANGTNIQKLQTEEMLHKVCQAMRHKVDEIKSEQLVKEKCHHKVSSLAHATTEQSFSSPSMSDDIPKSTKASSTASEDNEKNLQVFAKLVVEISSAEASTEFLTAHLVLTIDSGGQPHFMDVAPLFLRNSSLFLLTIKLNERLDSKPKFNFFIDGQPIEMSSTELKPTNLQLIELLAKSISALQFMASSTPLDRSGSRHAKFMIVGTFADKAADCQDESVADKNSILRAQLKDYEAERIDSGNDIIFAVNAITTNPNERRKAALRLQDKITNTPGTTIRTKIKLRWFGLLLYLLDEAEKKGLAVIPLKDVLAAGRCLQMPDSETLEAIAFFHELNLIMYFATDKLVDVIFIDMKPILAKVSNLIIISFLDKDRLDEIFSPNLPADAQRLLRDYGRFSQDILDSSFHFKPPLTTDVFLNLLEHLCVIARIEKDGQTSFFLPCALPHAPENILQEKEQISSLWIVMLKTRRGTTWVDVPIPKSYLPTLAVHLLNSPEFEADLETCQYRNLMSVRYVRGGRVYLLERSIQLEIFYPSADDDEEISMDCSFIRSRIMNALVKVEERLHFVPGILVKNDAFFCSCNDSRHVCLYNSDRERMYCNKSEKLRKLNQQQQCWLQPVKATISASPTTVQAPSTPPTGTDTVSQFQFLEAVASKIPAKWRKVGLSLGISSCVLDGIEKHRRGDCLECFSDVFTCWQQQSTPQSPVNWATLVTVLQSNYVGEEELSDTVRNMFI